MDEKEPSPAPQLVDKDKNIRLKEVGIGHHVQLPPIAIIIVGVWIFGSQYSRNSMYMPVSELMAVNVRLSNGVFSS